MSWRHFVLGLAELGRSQAGESLMLASSVRVAQASADDYRNWTRTLGSIVD